jgi:transposase
MVVYHSEEDKQGALDAYKKGMTPKEISELTGISKGTISSWISVAGISRKTTMLTAPDKVKSIIALSSQGTSTAEISRRLGLSDTTVRNWLHKFNQGTVKLSPPNGTDTLKEITKQEAKDSKGYTHAEIAASQTPTVQMPAEEIIDHITKRLQGFMEQRAQIMTLKMEVSELEAKNRELEAAVKRLSAKALKPIQIQIDSEAIRQSKDF